MKITVVFKARNITNELFEWRKLASEKWILSTFTGILIELEDITWTYLNNNMNKITEKSRNLLADITNQKSLE